MSSQHGRPLSSDRGDIWEAFINDHPASFKRLFESYFEEMYGYGLKLCGKPSLVKDCIQELFKTVWERRGELGHIDSPNVYLFVSLRRKILKSIQKVNERREDFSEVDEETFLEFGIEEVIITDEIKHQNKKELQRALNQLSDRQKEVIYLHYYNGMSYAEIQEILSINRQSVRNHIYRGMETLRTLIDNKIMKLVISLLPAIPYVCSSLLF